MSPDDYLDLLTGICHRDLMPNAEALPPCRWWHWAALEAWQQRRVHLIMSRDGSELYLARFWLHEPREIAGRDPNADGCTLDSGCSTLLHFFARGDDDNALHDHPWDEFDSEIISGGYTERRPPRAWRDQHQPYADGGTVPGSRWADHERTVRTAQSGGMVRTGRDQHAVEDVLPETYSLVHTGIRMRPWGFHPEGRPWMPYRQFLAEKRAPQAQAGGAS